MFDRSLRHCSGRFSGKIQSYNPSKMATAPPSRGPERRLEGSADLSGGVPTPLSSFLLFECGFQPDSHRAMLYA